MPHTEALSALKVCDIKINYFKAVYEGIVSCTSTVVNRGKRIANVESDVLVGDQLVARANGNFAIFNPA